jgi:hypothetical protein
MEHAQNNFGQFGYNDCDDGVNTLQSVISIKH